MPSLVSALKDSSDPKLQMAAIGCLHSLSRSVQLLRTTFQDHPMCEPLMKLLNSSPIELRIVASSTLCNLLLEFSPSKEPILKKGAIEKLCKLTYDAEPALRLNAVWGLMVSCESKTGHLFFHIKQPFQNVAFQAEERIKEEILNSLEPDQIFRLLSDKDINVVMKTLGLLRNLLSNKLHIDHIMSSYGKQIMQVICHLSREIKPCLTAQVMLCRPSFSFWRVTTCLKSRSRPCASWPTLRMATRPSSSSCPTRMC